MDNQRYMDANVEAEFEEVIGCGEIDGYSLIFSRQTPDGGRVDIIQVGGHVEGKVYRIGVTGLDYFFCREGVYVDAYRPALIDVNINGKQVRDVLVFLNVNKQDEVSPPEWYAEEILRGAKGCVSDAYWNVLTSKIHSLQGIVHE